MARQGRWRDRPLGALTTAFLARFFENEITAGTNDMRNSFFWLIAFLAVPGLLAPFSMMFSWSVILIVSGPDGLREAARADKILYLGFTMSATGLVAAIVWNALLVDRRDALVLGVLPATGSRIVGAKLLALGAYIAIIAAGMHTLASLSFGFALADGSATAFMLRNVTAHFVASCLASAFVVTAVTAVQGLALAALGPPSFRRLSPVLQLALVAAVVGGMLLLPTLSLSVNDTLAGLGGRSAPWVLYTPPAWFLGLYEVILGTDDETLWRLTWTAVAALAVATGVTVASFPAAYRRIMVAAVEQPDGGRRGSLTRRWARLVTSTLSRHPTGHAALFFLLATMGRSERHRFAIATALGFAAALALPGGLYAARALQGGVESGPHWTVLGLPVGSMVVLMVGLRVAIALPADLRPTWLVHAIEPAARPVHGALRRLLLVVGLLPVLVQAVVVGALWGWPLAVTHTLLAAVMTAVLADALLFGAGSMPCTTPWRPERANLRAFWFPYLLVFLAITRGLPALALALTPRPGALLAVLGTTALLWTMLRRWAVPRDAAAPFEDGIPSLQVLNLD